MIRTIQIKVRKCGQRKEGGLYLVGGTGDESKEGVLSRFNRINPPVPYQVAFHRSPRFVDADTVLSREPVESWWIGSSRKTQEEKDAAKWSLDTFGMTLAKRLKVGECAGCLDGEAALARLAETLSLSRSDKRSVGYLQELVVHKVNELPRVGVFYEKVLQNFYGYHQSGRTSCLVNVLAGIWNIAYTVPPSKRSEIYPILVRMLLVINAKKDALALKILQGV